MTNTETETKTVSAVPIAIAVIVLGSMFVQGGVGVARHMGAPKMSCGQQALANGHSDIYIQKVCK